MTACDKIQFASLTDVGIRRPHNQDALLSLPAVDREQWLQRGHFFLVADGMGAHAVGELASKLAVDIIPHTYTKHAHEGPAAALRKAFVEANLTIHSKGQQNQEFAGMGTTGTGLLLRPEGAWISHVGDSRTYRIRGGQIEQLTFDHSLHWELAKRQHVNPDQLQGIPSNVIVRSLGPEPLVQIDIEGPHPIQVGDIYVMCSDGLSGPVSDHEIGAVASVLPPDEACRFLVDLANLRGGPDNITVVIVRVDGTSQRGDIDALPLRKRWSIFDYVPWPFAALFLGVLLGSGAAALTYNKLWGGLPLFLLAVVALASGLVGLFIHHKQEQEKIANQPEPTSANVYTKAPCSIEPALLDKLIKAESILHQRVREKHWEADWDTFQHFHELAELHRHREEWSDTFREYCRSTTVLIQALLQHRTKDEMFQPVWEK